MIQNETIQYNSRQDKTRQYKAIQGNNNNKQAKLSQSKTIKDKTMQYDIRPDKTRQFKTA